MKHADLTLSRVAYSAIKVVLKALVLISLIGYVGIETASISAVVATLGVGVSLAVQGTLANFAGGIIIILMRPFRIGDFITTNGESGTVEEIKLFYTHIVTPDNRVIYVPNGNVANNVIVNVSVKDTRRVEVVMSVAYDSNIALVKEVIRKVFAANELILTNPAPFVDVTQYANSSIDLVCRAWVKSSDYWTVNFYLLNEIKKAFDENGIQVPYDTLDVNVITK
jgi:small conductance mechanosensitive channel